jgi:hypothetical protein
MENITWKPECRIETVKKEIRQFVTEDSSYFCVTMKGEVFYIVAIEVISADEEDPGDFYSYMWIKTPTGYYILSQRFYKYMSLNWVVDVEVTPDNDNCFFFYEMRDYLRENSMLLREICGEPLEQELPDLSKTWTLGILNNNYLK